MIPEFIHTAEHAASHLMGWFHGVFVRVTLSIFGVIMFLRMNWMVGASGLGLSLLVVAISCFITITVAFSVSSLCSNGRLLAGGPYDVINLSLGTEAAHVIGIADFWSQVLSVALNVIGFSEVVLAMGGVSLTGSEGWDMVIIAIAATSVLLIISIIGTHWVNRLNMLFFILICGGVVLFIIGTLAREPGFIPGFTGYSAITFSDNWRPHFEGSVDFYLVFGVFFPAVTGVLQGVEVSAELKDPARAIPLGTLLSILFTTSVYVLLLFVCAFTATYHTLENTDEFNYVIDISLWRPFLYASAFAATLSTALSMLGGAPRVLAAMLKDGVFPRLNFLTRTNAKGDPVVGTVAVAVLAAAAIILAQGQLDSIAPLVTNLFLLEYVIINYATFLSFHARSPSWRPKFKHSGKWHALSGVFACFALMFVVSYQSAVVMSIVAGLIYKYVETAKPHFSFDDEEAPAHVSKVGAAMDARLYLMTRDTVYRLAKRAQTRHLSYRPSFLLMSNFCHRLSDMRLLVAQLYKSHSMIVLGQVVPPLTNIRSLPVFSAVTSRCSVVHAYCPNASIVDGAMALLHCQGVGPLRANCLVIEFPEAPAQSELAAQVGSLLHQVLAAGDALIMVRHPRLGKDVDVGFDAVAGTLADRAGYPLHESPPPALGPDQAPEQCRFVDVYLIDDSELSASIARYLILNKSFADCKVRVFTLDSQAGSVSLASVQNVADLHQRRRPLINRCVSLLGMASEVVTLPSEVESEEPALRHGGIPGPWAAFTPELVAHNSAGSTAVFISTPHPAIAIAVGAQAHTYGAPPPYVPEFELERLRTISDPLRGTVFFCFGHTPYST